MASTTEETNNNNSSEQQPHHKAPAATTTAETEPPVQPEEYWQVQRDALKEKGDAAFRARGFRTAISEYTSAISLDPEHVVLCSNRSAAYLANSEISKALKDAQQCVDLDPAFTKGYSRLAAALFALRRYEKAKKAYEKVLEKDASNKAAQQGVELCEKELEKIRQKQKEEAQWQQEEETQKTEPAESEAVKETPEADNGGGGDDDEDDLLADFFDEVEDVVTKQKQKVAAAVNAEPSATNAIRNDRTALGTTKDQIARLLQPHYEWRNLNPFYVLELPHTATDDDISRRYKALSLLLHPDKNHAKLRDEKEKEQCQLAYDQVQKAKQTLADEDRKRHMVALVEEGMKAGEHKYAKQQSQQQQQSKKKWTGNNANNSDDKRLQDLQTKEIMRIFAQVEQKRREVEERERNYEQRQQQQQDEQEDKERKERQFDKRWRQEGGQLAGFQRWQ